MTAALSILVLDDEPEVVASVSAMLTEAARVVGSEILVKTALTGLDALVLCRNQTVHALFVDYNLGGGMNGDEFLTRLPGAVVTRPALIVMMSGMPEEDLAPAVTRRHRLLGLQFRFLRKPVSALTIQSCLMNLVELVRSDIADTILIAAPKAIEWEAWRQRLLSAHEIDPGFLVQGTIGRANAVVAATGKGQAITAATLAPLLATWQPRYVLVVGIAGGLERARRGDVVVGSFVYSFDVGKVENGTFRSRPEQNWSADKKLLDVATNIAEDPLAGWRKMIQQDRPACRGRQKPAAHVGYFGSSEKVIDDLDYPVITDALAAAPETLAVEMEGIGASTAIRAMHANGQLHSHAGLLMIRGVSDEPRRRSPRGSGSGSRSRWASYAADLAAAFAQALILRLYSEPGQPAVEQSGDGSM